MRSDGSGLGLRPHYTKANYLCLTLAHTRERAAYYRLAYYELEGKIVIITFAHPVLVLSFSRRTHLTGKHACNIL